jgi:hypothetical protein
VGSRLFVVHATLSHQPQQSRRAEHEDVVEAFPPYGSDEPFDIRILPGDRGAVSTSRISIAAAVRADAANA